MKRKQIHDLNQLQNKYKDGGYLMLSGDEKTVLAYGKNFKIMFEKAKKRGYEKRADTVTMYLPPKNRTTNLDSRFRGNDREVNREEDNKFF